MKWTGELEGFALWACDPKVAGGEAFQAALRTVPDDKCSSLSVVLNTRLLADRNRRGITALDADSGRQLFTDEEIEAWRIPNDKIADVDSWRRESLDRLRTRA